MGQIAWKSALLSACAGALALLAQPAAADELNWTHYGVRPLAMGNAFVAVADDYNALFYNPAGLARLKTWSGELLNPSLAISTNTIQAIEGIETLVGSSSTSIDNTLDFLQKNTGKTQYIDLGWTPHLVFPGFGFGIGADIGGDLVIHRDVTADVDIGPRIIAPIAFAKNFLEDRLSIGIGVKFVAQGGVNHQFSVSDIDAFTSKSSSTTSTTNGTTSTGAKLSDFVEGGYGVGGDFGVLYTPVKPMSPTFGLSITDFGGTPFTKTNVSGQALSAPRTRLPSVNTGFSLRPWEAHGMYLLTAVDADAINQPIHYSKKVNLGAEWGYGSIIKVETGLHEGEYSAGLQFDVFLFTLRFVTYSEQVGTIAGQDDNLRDRRYALQLKLLI